jgi:hypothetical protein
MRKKTFQLLGVLEKPLWGVLGTLLMTAIGCNDAVTNPTRTEIADQLWEVRLERRAITMSTVAPYDTITLRPIALNVFGDTLSDSDGMEVHYHSVSDTTIRISDEGVLTVRVPTSSNGIKIIARVTYNNVTLTDTATVVVTNQPSPPRLVDTIVLEVIHRELRTPRLPIWSINDGSSLFNPTIVSTIRGSDSTVITAPISYTSSDPSVVTFSHLGVGEIIPRSEGTATITATTTWYGKTHHTTLDITVIGAVSGSFEIEERIPRGSDTAVTVITPRTIVVEPDAIITWSNRSARPIDIIFDDPTHVREVPSEQIPSYLAFLCLVLGQGCHLGKTGGTISLAALVSTPGGDPTASIDMRYFPVSGTYRFQTTSGATGTIIVK